MTADLEARFRAGERAALARVLTLVENDPNVHETWIGKLPPIGRAKVVGITGPPGGGKSSLVNRMISAYRQRDRSVAVLAFDPSSRLTGGAALGDRVRMMETWDDDKVYVRSLASRGRLGGLSDAVFGALRVLEAYGVDVILIETVGVGQGEIDIADIADVTVLIQVPGTGDTVQLIKAGVLEVADILVVNKADLPGAERLYRDLSSLVHEVDPKPGAASVVKTSAAENQGIDELICQIEGRIASKAEGMKARRAAAELRHLVLSRAERRVNRQLRSPEGVALIDAVARGELHPQEAIERLGSWGS